MAAKFGAIHAIVTANTSNFSRQMKRGEKSLRTFGSGIGGITRKLKGFGIALAGVGSAAGLFLKVRSAIVDLRTLTLQADKLGIATKQLIGLQFAAEQQGIGISRFTVSLQRFGRRLGEGAHNAGEMVKAFKTLGLTFEELSLASIDKALFRVADRMDKVRNSGERLRLAMKMFDSEGVDFVNIMKGGSAAMKAQIADAQRLGILFDRGQLQIALDAVQAMNRAGRAIGGLFSKVGLAIGPELTVALNTIANLIASVPNVMGFVRSTMRELAGIVGRISDVFTVDIPIGMLQAKKFGLHIAKFLSEDKLTKGLGDRMARILLGVRGAEFTGAPSMFSLNPRTAHTLQRNPNPGPKFHEVQSMIPVEMAKIAQQISLKTLVGKAGGGLTGAQRFQGAIDAISLVSGIKGFFARIRQGNLNKSTQSFVGAGSLGLGASGHATARQLGIINGKANFSASTNPVLGAIKTGNEIARDTNRKFDTFLTKLEGLAAELFSE